MTVEEDLLPLDEEEVAISLHEGSGTAVLLTHGAGGNKDDPGLVALAEGLAAAGLAVVRANLPYRQAGRAIPPRADRAVPGLQQMLAALDDRLPADVPWVLGGKSYGGRVASVAVAAGTPVLGLVFYSYPLHPRDHPERLRVDHWPRVDAPCCFLQGTRDPLCDLALLRANLPRLPREPRLLVVEGGDHSLHVRGRDRPDGRHRPPVEVLADLAGDVADWIGGLPGATVP